MNIAETYNRLSEATQSVTVLRCRDRATADYADAVARARRAIAELAEYAAADGNDDLAMAAYRLGQIVDEVAHGQTA